MSDQHQNEDLRDAQGQCSAPKAEWLSTCTYQQLFGLRVRRKLSSVHNHGTSYSGDATLKEKTRSSTRFTNCKLMVSSVGQSQTSSL